MDYGRIISRSFEIAWQHKWLWIFGMFAAATGFNLKFEYLLGISPSNPFDMTMMENIDPKALIASYLGLLPLGIIMGLMALFSTASIIDSVNRIERGGSYSFSSAFSAGIDYFFRIIGLGIIFFVVTMVYFMSVVLLIVLLSKISGILAGFASFIMFFVSIIIGLAALQVLNIAYRVIVLRNSGIIEAIGESVQLVKMYFGKNVAAFFIIFGFGFGFAMMVGIMWFILNFPIDAMIQAMHLTSLPAMLAALFIGMPLTYLLAGYFGVFTTTFMTLFYIELVDPKPESAYFPQPPKVDFDQ